MVEADQKDLWVASLYDAKHSFVSNYGNDLVDLLKSKAWREDFRFRLRYWRFNKYFI